MKKCSRCKELKPIEELGIKGNSYCKKCRREYYHLKKLETRPHLEQKTCSKCGLVSSVSNFNRKCDSKDGYGSICLNCRGIKKKEYKILGPVEASYLAGIIDGEGYIGLCKYKREQTETRYFGRLVIRLTSLEIFEIRSLFPYGATHTVISKNPKHKVAYQWTLSTGPASNLCSQILPYLRIKKEQASLLIEYSKISMILRKDNNYRHLVKKIYDDLRLLNTRGVKI